MSQSLQFSAKIQPLYVYLVTLVHPRTEDERSFYLVTETDSFSPVLRAIQKRRSELNLHGYEIFEVLDENTPF